MVKLLKEDKASLKSPHPENVSSIGDCIERYNAVYFRYIFV